MKSIGGNTIMNFEDLKNQILNPEDETELFDPIDMQTNKAVGVLASIPILFWLPLVACKDSQYGKFCANQGLILFVLCVVLNFAQPILSKILWYIPILGHILPKLLGIVFGLVEAAGFLFLFISACQGKARKIPFIGKLFHAFN